MTKSYLQNIQERSEMARSSLPLAATWKPESIALFLRAACLTGPVFDRLAHLDYEPIDLKTYRVIDPERDAQLTLMLDSATPASLGCRLLFELAPGVQERDTWSVDSAGQRALSVARRLYIDAAVLRIQGTPAMHAFSQHGPSLDDFKQTALECFLRVQDDPHIPARPWDILIPDDARWSMAAPVHEMDQLRTQWPQTNAWLDAFQVQCQFFSPHEALGRVWAEHVPKSTPSTQELESFGLPPMDM